MVAHGTGFTATAKRWMCISYASEPSLYRLNHLARPVGLTGWSPKATLSFKQPGRQADCQTLVYTASDDKFVLTGGPPSIFDAERGKITGVSLTFFRGDDRVLVEGEAKYSCGNTDASGQIR